MPQRKKTVPQKQSKAATSELDDLWDVKRCAQFLGVSESAIYDRVEAREIPFTRISPVRGIRFIPSQIMAWLEENSVKTVSDEELSRPKRRGG